MRVNLASVLSLIAVASAGLDQQVVAQIFDDAFWSGWTPPRSTLSEAYRQEAVSLLLREANQVALALQLPERLPITELHLTERYFSPLRYAQENGAIGNITTSNYTYCVSRSNKLCYVMGLRQEENLQRWEKDYSWPLSRMDTNAAYRLATQWLAAVSMDVDGLNRAYPVYIRAEESYRKPEHFIPVYAVFWAPPLKGSLSVASVRLFAPTKTLMQLRVENPHYILRQPITFTNLEALLAEPKSK